ncbi:hypothetical protein [Ferrithrix thermotolerans]|uniref:hypothetical protein n=1 Tax=Ferrithrix thermotolerans TaxID=209649 RepID=UPI0011606167|nr:hypothetical protein [Ferrithrix thermotolerans]
MSKNTFTVRTLSVTAVVVEQSLFELLWGLLGYIAKGLRVGSSGVHLVKMRRSHIIMQLSKEYK